ncbi:MAG TPA: hypothetical protein VGV38_12545, partial [Pyrinomonadaceae bacterium]|nr:hypothetical protein [Pyrinomonadaceae bacterium]
AHTGAGDHDSLARIELDEETRRSTVRMVEEIFDLFEDWAEEMLRYAAAHLADGVLAAPPLQAAA